MDKMRQEAYKVFGDRLDIDTSKRGRGSAARSLSPQRNTDGGESPSKVSSSKVSGFSPLRRATLGSQETEGSVRMSDASSNFGDSASNAKSITAHGLIMGGDQSTKKNPKLDEPDLATLNTITEHPLPK